VIKTKINLITNFYKMKVLGTLLGFAFIISLVAGISYLISMFIIAFLVNYLSASFNSDFRVETLQVFIIIILLNFVAWIFKNKK